MTPPWGYCAGGTPPLPLRCRTAGCQRCIKNTPPFSLLQSTHTPRSTFFPFNSALIDDLIDLVLDLTSDRASSSFLECPHACILKIELHPEPLSEYDELYRAYLFDI